MLQWSSQEAATRLAECIELLDRWMGQRSEAERREDPAAVAWITTSVSQADRLSAPSVDSYVIVYVQAFFSSAVFHSFTV